MYDNKGIYRRGGFTQLFTNSCLGQLIIVVVLIVVVVLIAAYTVPSEERMVTDTTDAISRCIEDNKLSKCDRIDDGVRNVTSMFTDCDSAIVEANMELFNQYNRIEVYPHTLYSTARIHSNFIAEGVRVAIGIFGMVIPTVSYNDMVLRDAVIRKDYNQRIIINESIYDPDAPNPDDPDYGNTYNTYGK